MPTEKPRSTALHYGLWAVQILLALFFAMAGGMKATQPMPELVEQLQWPDEIPFAVVRFIGISEILGAFGLTLPAALRVLPVLTPAAAGGIM